METRTIQGKPHLIVIDDDPIVRLLVVKALEEADIRVSEASSGEEGLRIFAERGADAVLLDVMMPTGIDGFATCLRLRSMPEGRLTPVLMMTGLDDQESINRAFEIGATDFITKPINFSLLRYRVRYMLRGSDTIKRLAESEQRLHHLAYFDHLTELPNRQFFREHLQHMVGLASRQGGKLAVLFLDLDRFKFINDTLGHNLGDVVLQEVGERLQHCIRASDAIVRAGVAGDDSTLARLGGDEFTILLSAIERDEDVVIVAERIREALAQPFKIGDHELFTTTSIGIAVYPDDGDSAEELLKNADLAMYHAKRSGGDRYQYFKAAMTQSALHRMSMENQLRQAIDRGELDLHYQPELDAVSGGILGVEALLRWNNPVFGSIPPEVAIPLAEETGLIMPVGEWVLRRACAQAKSWRDQGIRLARMAVNVSPVQFMHHGFPSLVSRILDETGLEPSLLELELTESALLSDEVRVRASLVSLKEKGVQLAIDDFGTGYSSLSRLKQFPIDRLKIDQGFVQDVENNADSAAIAVAVIAMAESMHMKVTAEGVETDAQLAFLRAKGCDEVQGFLLCMPLPADQALGFLRSHSG